MKQRSYETKNDEFVNTGFVRKQKKWILNWLSVLKVEILHFVSIIFNRKLLKIFDRGWSKTFNYKRQT